MAKKLAGSSRTEAHATLRSMFPQSPPFIPYGGFSPVRLEVSVRTRAFPFSQFALAPPGFPVFVGCPGVVSPLPGNPLTRSHVCDRHSPTGPSLRPAVLVSATGLSLLRPDPSVSRIPHRFCCYTMRSLRFPPSESLSLLCLVRPSAPAATSTPPGIRVLRMVAPANRGAFTPFCRVRLSGVTPKLASLRVPLTRRQSSLHAAAGALARAADQSPPALPRTGPPVYCRACPSQGLPQLKSAITTRFHHQLPRRDLHPLACQRSKAAPKK